MKLKPRTHRVLIRPIGGANRTKSGLHVVEHRKVEQVGTVIAVGTDVRDCAVDDVVLFSWQSGQEFVIQDGERLIVLNERDVLAIVGQGVEIDASEPILA